MICINQLFATLEVNVNWSELLLIIKEHLQTDVRGIDIMRTELMAYAKLLVVQSTFRLTDEDAFEFAKDSRSVSIFIGLITANVMEYKFFRQVLNDACGIRPFFTELEQQLKANGYELVRGSSQSPCLTMNTGGIDNILTGGYRDQVTLKLELTKERTELYNIVDSYIGHQKKDRPYTKEKFADECGFKYTKALNRVLGGKRVPSHSELNGMSQVPGKTIQEIECLIYNPYDHFKIKHQNNSCKSLKSLAGKTCWNPKINAWEYQIVLYNKLNKPPGYSHEVWEALRHIYVPVREGYIAWETDTYLYYEIR